MLLLAAGTVYIASIGLCSLAPIVTILNLQLAAGLSKGLYRKPVLSNGNFRTFPLEGRRESVFEKKIVLRGAIPEPKHAHYSCSCKFR